MLFLLILMLMRMGWWMRKGVCRCWCCSMVVECCPREDCTSSQPRPGPNACIRAPARAGLDLGWAALTGTGVGLQDPRWFVLALLNSCFDSFWPVVWMDERGWR